MRAPPWEYSRAEYISLRRCARWMELLTRVAMAAMVEARTMRMIRYATSEPSSCDVALRTLVFIALRTIFIMEMKHAPCPTRSPVACLSGGLFRKFGSGCLETGQL